MDIDGKARLGLYELRDRLVLLHALCASLATIAVTAPPPLVDRMEVLAMEASSSSEQALLELSALVASLS